MSWPTPLLRQVRDFYIFLEDTLLGDICPGDFVNNIED